MAIVEGKKAPAFTLTDQDGKKVSLSDFTLKKLGVVVLGVSGDDAASHTKFRAKYKLPFTLLSDPSKKTMTAYGAYGEKTMYGKKVVGVIRSTVWVGPDGTVKKHWARVPKADEHPTKVLEALQAG